MPRPVVPLPLQRGGSHCCSSVQKASRHWNLIRLRRRQTHSKSVILIWFALPQQPVFTRVTVLFLRLFFVSIEMSRIANGPIPHWCSRHRKSSGLDCRSRGGSSKRRPCRSGWGDSCGPSGSSDDSHIVDNNCWHQQRPEHGAICQTRLVGRRPTEAAPVCHVRPRGSCC